MQTELAIGVDIGGTLVRIGVVNNKGKLLKKIVCELGNKKTPSDIIEFVVKFTEEIINQYDKNNLKGLGVCAPGPLDSHAGVVKRSANLKDWKDVPLRDLLKKQTGLDVQIENDAFSAAMGEWIFGAGKNYNNIVYVGVGTGIGGGVICNGSLIRGYKGFASHLGHMKIVNGGKKCACSGNGCFEAYASGNALASFADHTIKKNSLIFTISNGNKISAKNIADAARLGDSEALRLIKQEAEYLGFAFSNLIHLYSPEIIIFGGGVSKSYDLMSDRITEVMNKNKMPGFSKVIVKPSKLFQDAGLYGAANLFLKTK